MNITFNERYARQIVLPGFGQQAQRRLSQASALVAGVGGLGSTLAPLLCAAGIGRLILVDGDRVSLSNLQRQTLYRTDQIGRPKVECAAQTLHRLNPDVSIEIHDEFLTEANAQETAYGADILIDGTDNPAARYLMDDLSRKLKIPYVYGSIQEYKGQVAVFNLTPQSASYRDLYPYPNAAGATVQQPNAPQGVIATLPSLIAALQTHEVIKILTGCGKPLDNRLLLIDIQTPEITTVRLK